MGISNSLSNPRMDLRIRNWNALKRSRNILKKEVDDRFQRKLGADTHYQTVAPRFKSSSDTA
jgi:hypothetical protein